MGKFNLKELSFSKIIIMNEILRTCKACHVEKILFDSYYRDRNNFKHTCNLCSADADRVYQRLNKEAIRIQQSKYRCENAEALRIRKSEYYATLPGRFSKIRNRAREKSIPWDATTMTFEAVAALITSRCFWCSHTPAENEFVGIDRLDSHGIYTINNCVPACWKCNNAKGSMDPLTFHEQSLHLDGRGHFPDAFPDTKANSFANCQYQAVKRNLEFAFTKEDHRNVITNPCTHCGKQNSSTHQNGVDRIDSNRGYTMDNVQSACTNCNLRKGDMPDNEFHAHNASIAATQHPDLPNVPRQLRNIFLSSWKKKDVE